MKALKDMNETFGSDEDLVALDALAVEVEQLRADNKQLKEGAERHNYAAFAESCVQVPEAELRQLKQNVRPSKSDASKLALATIEDWINHRGVTGIDRARKQLLVEALAEVFGAPEVKEAEGVS